MTLKGSCECGAVELYLDINPWFIYNCHCSHCRAFASKFASIKSGTAEEEVPTYHSGATIWKWNVRTVGGPIEYEKTTALFGLFAMSRGRCSHCKDPILEDCHRLAEPFTMIMSKPFDFRPSCNIFYDSGHKKGTNGLKTIHTDLGSLLYEIWMILVAGVPNIPYSLYARLTRGSIEETKSD